MTNPIKPDLESLTTPARIHDGLDLEAIQHALFRWNDGYVDLGAMDKMFASIPALIAEIRRLRATHLELIQECQRLREDAKPLTWSREKPTECGDYWRWVPGWREPMYEQVIGEPRLKYGLYIHGEERDEYIADINDGSYWMPVQIPIPPPQPEGTK